jgi:hypothetical protein
MRLLRTAFWLGITIYCLPSFNSHPTAPDPSPNANQCQSTKAADPGRLCALDLGAAERPQVLVKRGEHSGDGSSRETVMRSQNTLIRSDLATPWRGSAVRKDLEAKRPIRGALPPNASRRFASHA